MYAFTGYDSEYHSMPSLEDRARAKEFVELHDQVEVRGRHSRTAGARRLRDVRSQA